jgi:hypothetical protein
MSCLWMWPGVVYETRLMQAPTFMQEGTLDTAAIAGMHRHRQKFCLVITMLTGITGSNTGDAFGSLVLADLAVV